MTDLHITPLGVLLAIIFSLSMGGIIFWMLRVPPQVSIEVAKAHRGVGALKRILVPTLGVPYSERGIELACRLGEEQKAEVILTYVIEVPRTLPLDASLPDVEIQAEQALRIGEDIVSLHGLKPVRRIERSREAAEGIIRAAKDTESDVIVLGIKSHLSMVSDIFGRTTERLLHKAPCEVIIDKVFEEE